ncbi:MAG: UDP-N-acetylmuramate--L-alanine ligase [Caldilineaceae bacterium]|nr:UDP-N-acetylmuramate--L-alanine ligase [Caldilineaceae bacterium]
MKTTDSSLIGTKSWQERLSAKDPTLRLHLLGIGGAGLSAIAKVLLEMGFQVSGSDRQLTANTDRLAAAGATILGEQQATNVTTLGAEKRPDVILISSAIGGVNPEFQAWTALGVPIVKRADFLPVLLANRKLIAVAGTHGKSTTTAMIVKVLREAGIAAGYIIGADLPGYGNAAAGTDLTFILEADEYDHMFLGLRPTIAVVTNVEWDHPDCYPTPASFHAAFAKFVEGVVPDGVIIACNDDPGAEQLRLERPLTDQRWITYGLTPAADICAHNPTMIQAEGYAADLYWWNAPREQLRLQVPGLHNLRNALATLAVACTCDASLTSAVESLGAFTGTARRFEKLGEVAGVTVIDDYAHNPTKVRATLAAARSRYPQRRLWAVVQPHTYSRTRSLLQQMADSFQDADQVIITDIYAAREPVDLTISAASLVAASSHPHIQHIAGLQEVADYLAQQVRAGDVVITMGAGTSNQIGPNLLQQVGKR